MVRLYRSVVIDSIPLRLCGVSGFVDFFQFADADLCVDLSCLRFRMTEHGLDEAHVRAVFEHQRGHCVAEQVTASRLAEVGGDGDFMDHLSQSIGRERFAEMSQEQHDVVRIDQQTGADFADVFVDPPDRSFADGNHPVLFAFALSHHQRASVNVHVVELQVDDFHAADAGRVQRFEDGPVTQAE